MIKNHIWVVTAHRFTTEHSYVVGVYESDVDAEKAAHIEATNRGGKYNLLKTLYTLNEMPDDLIDIERD